MKLKYEFYNNTFAKINPLFADQDQFVSVSKVSGSRTFANPKYRPVTTRRYFWNRWVVLLFVWTLKPMLLSLTQHSIKNCLILTITTQTHMIYVREFFLAFNFFSNSLVSKVPGSCFKSVITLWKCKKISKQHEDISIGTRMSQLFKKWVQKISWDCPF